MTHAGADWLRKTPRTEKPVISSIGRADVMQGDPSKDRHKRVFLCRVTVTFDLLTPK